MYISVAENGDLGLQDADNFRSFAIVCVNSDASLEQLERIASAAEDNHYWLDAEAVLQLAERRQDPQWVKQFNAMLDSVTPYGYFDPASNRIKAHLETAADPD